MLYLLEVQILEGEMDFNNTSGFHTCPQNILFCWLVFFCTKAVEIIQKAKNWKWRLLEILIMRTIKTKMKREKYQISSISFDTYYFAESFSWYSLEREKHCVTPVSTHSRFIPANSSSENGSVSSILETTSITILASA